MTDKERVHAAMEGRPVDRMPVHASYSQLYHMDHFDELTGLPRHYYKKWLYSPAGDLLNVFGQMLEAAPFDIVQPPRIPSESERADVAFVERDGKPFLYHRRDDRLESVAVETESGHGCDDYRANELQLVFDRRDIDEKVKVVPAQRQIAHGAADGLRAVAEAFGRTRFIMTGGVVGTIYGCGEWLGQTNLFACLLEKPDLVDYLCRKITEQNIETIRVLAHAGGDAIYIDDATATADMISPQMYERFSLPYMEKMIDEIKRLNHKAVIIYFGGISDRLQLIASLGADGLNMEASMKGYVNDLGEIARTIGYHITPFANINPYTHIEQLSDGQLEQVMLDQAEAGKQARGLIMCSASPITMHTPLSRVRKFIEIGRSLPVPRRRQP